ACRFVGFALRRVPARSPLFPYTTLFRSGEGAGEVVRELGGAAPEDDAGGIRTQQVGHRPAGVGDDVIGVALPHRHRDRPPGSKSDRKSTRLNSSHVKISYAVFCLKKKKE